MASLPDHARTPNPLGVKGPDLLSWCFPTRVFRSMTQGPDAGGETGVDHRIAEEGLTNVGAWILGPNMFGPVRPVARRELEGLVG